MKPDSSAPPVTAPVDTIVAAPSREVSPAATASPAASDGALENGPEPSKPEAAAGVPIDPSREDKDGLSDFELTALSVDRTFVFTDGAKSRTILTKSPVYYRTGSVYLTPDRLKELEVIEGEIRDITEASEELRIAMSILLEKYNSLLERSVPTPVLVDNSISRPIGHAPAAKSSAINIPQPAIQIKQD